MSGTAKDAGSAFGEKAEVAWSALEHMGVAVLLADADARVTRVSRAFADLFGVSPAAIEGHDYEDLASPTERDHLWATGQVEFERQVRHRDGSPIHVRFSATTIGDEQGRPSSFLVLVTNVGEIVAAQQALASSEERARRLVDTSPIGIVEVDEDGSVVAVNGAAGRLLGRARGAMVGRPLASFLPLTDADLTEARQPQDVEVSRPDGTTRWLSVDLASLPGPGDRVPRALLYLVDIHERVLFQAATFSAQQRARRIADLSPDATSVAGDDDVIIYANPAFAELVKVSDHRALAGRRMWDFIPPGSVERASARRKLARAGRTVKASEEEVVAADGSTIPVEVSSSAYELDGQTAVLSVRRDITERRRAEETRARLRARQRTLVETLAEGVVLFDVDDAGEPTPLFSNRAAYELFGLDPQEGNPDPRSVRYINLQGVPLDYRELPAWVTARTGEPVIGHVWGVRRGAGDDDIVWVRSTSRPVVGPDGSMTGVVASMVDVTADERVRREVASAQARFAALVEHGSDTITVMDREGALRYASPAFEHLFGRSSEAAVPSNLFDLVHPEDRDHVRSVLGDLADRAGGFVTFECRVAHADGDWRNVEMTSSNRLGDPAVEGIVINTRDVTERVRAANRLTFLALHDSLTELPNRTLLLDRLEQALSRASRTGQPCAVLYLDLDHFKLINDSLGHAAGDRVLRAVADRLRDTVRQGDSVARLSGDEFVVLAEEIESLDAALEIAGRIHEVVSEPVQLPERRVSIGCSLGIALSGRHRPDALLQEADTALYRAKASGRGRWALYDAAMGSMARQRLETEDVIRTALEDQRLVAVFQPIVDLVTAVPVATEALARIRDRSGTLILPADFIAVAEDSGQILTLGARILDHACAQQAAWVRRWGGGAPARVAVNLSARQLNSPALVTEIENTLERHELSPHQLCLELTETALIDAGTSTQRNIEAVEAMGVALAIDDFGTGWSSLGYVRRFRVDTLKIDRSFVSELGQDPDATAVVQAVIGLGRSLGLRTVAEGVTTEEHVRILRDLGCDAAQGHYFGRPELPDALTEGWWSEPATTARSAQTEALPGE